MTRYTYHKNIKLVLEKASLTVLVGGAIVFNFYAKKNYLPQKESKEPTIKIDSLPQMMTISDTYSIKNK